MAVFSVLLVVGTQILDWYWPVTVFLAALGIGLWRVRRRIPSSYAVLQQVDAAEGLHDSISTAYYYQRLAPDGRGHTGFREAQQQLAEEQARLVDLARAVPFRLPGSAYVALFSIVVAVSLFGVRYGVRRSLDLSPPVSQALVEFFRPSTAMAEAWEKSDAAEAPPEESAVEGDNPEGEKDRVDPDSSSRLAAIEADPLAPDSAADASDGAEPLGEGESFSESDAVPFDGDPLTSPEGAQSVDQGEDSGEPQFPQEDSDLLRKMQDAFANLMNKFNIPPKAGKNRRLASAESERSEGESEAQQQGQQTDAQQMGDGMPSAAGEGEQIEQGGQQAKTGAGEGQSEEGGQRGEQASQSAAGQQDGLKELKAAQQKEAMGQIEEIFGERAQNIKGEIMVEVSSGPQNLRTEYSESEATHRSAGTEVHRGEVPLELQPYVQRYFDEIRKTGRGAEQ